MNAEQILEILDDYSIAGEKINDYCIAFGDYGATMFGSISFGSISWDIISHNDLRMGTFSDESTLVEILQTHNMI